jgi:hypothetical protein
MGAGIDINNENKVSSLNNDGVLDFSGITGAINLIGGSGVSVVESTGVDGTDFTVSNTGVIELIAGGNISISGSNGSFTISATDAQTGTVTSVATGAGLTGGPITTSGTISLDSSGVTPGSYTYPSITVDSYGRVTVAANGSTPVTSINGTAPVQVTGSAPTLTVAVAPASTVAPGVVQLNDTVTSTSTTVAATSNAVKTAYDAATAAQGDATQALADAAAAQSTADAALPKAGGTMTGPIVFAPGQTIPIAGLPDATTASKGVVQVGTNIGVTGGVISVNTSSTSQLGVVQLNDSTNSTSTTQALTAAQGKNLQDQITALSVSSNITLGGTFNANTGLVDSVTTQGTAAGLVVGSALPAAAPANNEIFVIVDVQGSTGPSGTPPYHVGDWWLSNGTTWQFLNVGYQPGQATTLSQGTVQLATNAQVQAGTDTSNAVVSSSLQSKLSDSVATVSSTTIASSTAVKTAYDAAVAAQGTANAALPKAGGTMTGNITFNSGQTFPGVVTSVTAGTGLTGGTITSSGTIALDTTCVIQPSAFTTKGDLLSASATSTPVALGVGSNGQVLTACSTCTTGLAWITPAAGCTGTVTSITAGTGLTGGTITTSGTVALDTACVIQPSAFTAKGDLLSASAAATPTALGVGTNGQVLSACSACASGLVWATPQTSPFITYTTSAVSYTTGTPLLVAKWYDGTMQGTVNLDLSGYGGIQQLWDFYLSGGSTNYNTGWYQTASYPASPSDPVSQGTWYVDFPVYPSSDANAWMIYFSPSQNSLNPSSFTFFYRLLPGSSTPAFQI